MPLPRTQREETANRCVLSVQHDEHDRLEPLFRRYLAGAWSSRQLGNGTTRENRMLKLSVLGPVDLQNADGGRNDLLGLAKRLAVLCYVALCRGPGPVQRDSLLAMFWPEADSHAARNSLRQTLHVLDKHVGTAIAHDAATVWIDRKRFWCDAHAFEAALEAGDSRQALGLYRGEFLEGFHFTSASIDFERWLQSERQRWRVRAADAAWEMAKAASASGDLAQAARWAREGTALMQETEAAIRRLMAFWEENGDRTAAVDAYRGLVERLAAEDSRPSAATETILDQIRERTPTKGLPPEDVVRIMDRQRLWERSCVASDWDTIVSMVTDDFVFFSTDVAAQHGKKALRAWFEAQPQAKDYTTEILDIRGWGEQAWCHGVYTITLAVPGDEPVQFMGKFTGTWRKANDGLWYGASDVWSLDRVVGQSPNLPEYLSQRRRDQP